MKISRVIFVGFALILFLFAVTTFINYGQATRISASAERTAESSEVIRKINRFQRNFLSMIASIRGFAFTNEILLIQAYDSARQDNLNILEELRLNETRDPNQLEILNDVESLCWRWMNEIAVPVIEAGRPAAIPDSSRVSFPNFYRLKLVAGQENVILNTLLVKLNHFKELENEANQLERQRMFAQLKQIGTVSVVLTVISIVAGLCISFLVARHVSRRVVRMVRMADQIAGGDYNVSLPVAGNNEFGQLARALNRMSTTLAANFSLLTRKNEELNQFAYIVAHDLKAPLRGIDNVVSWIDEDFGQTLPAKVNEYIAVIKGRLVRAERLLNGIAAYSRVGREPVHGEWVEVSGLIAEIRDLLPASTPIELIVATPLPVLFTERVPLFQVLSNLIINAFKYHDKTEGGYVRLSVTEIGDEFEFAVCDNGPGIGEAYHQRIFQIFQTLNETDTIESTGVGLAIVKRILDDRGLSIAVQSTPGAGACFSFKWPKKMDYEKTG